jgi:hypothetical protein
MWSLICYDWGMLFIVPSLFRTIAVDESAPGHDHNGNVAVHEDGQATTATGGDDPGAVYVISHLLRSQYVIYCTKSLQNGCR